MNYRTSLASVLLVTLLIVTGCAGTPATGPASSSAPQAQVAPRAQTIKVLTVGETREPTTLFGFTGEGGTGGGAGIIGFIAHDFLTQTDPFGEEHPGLAAEVPSTERGTWNINPDGTMDVTWKLKQGVKWHDGTPFTAADLLFTLTLNKDPELFSADAGMARAIRSASSPDPYTFIVHWSRIEVLARSPRALTPMPKHLLEELYQTDKTAFMNSPFFRQQFVGLGPYRLASWSEGSHLEAVRFDDYHMGRPPLDRVIVRYILDQNTMVTNILAGAVDAVMPKSVETDAALQLRRQWEGTGNLARIEAIPRIIYLEMMMRPEYARPLNGLPNPTVRQALYHAIDRQGISEAATGGLGPPADSWYDPSDPLRREMESFIAKYPYDPARAQQLLTQAGWTRGSDGVLTHTSGERYATEVWVNPQASGPAGAVVVDNWKAVGVDSTLNNVPLARAQDRGYVAQRPGPLATDAGTMGTGTTERYNSRDLATAGNNWAGRNRAGYTNLRADELFDLLNGTIDATRRRALLQEQIQLFSSEVALMPLYWMIGNTLSVKGVKADFHPNAPGYRVYLWDRE